LEELGNERRLGKGDEKEGDENWKESKRAAREKEKWNGSSSKF
jgi:hypothetical protein